MKPIRVREEEECYTIKITESPHLFYDGNSTSNPIHSVVCWCMLKNGERLNQNEYIKIRDYIWVYYDNETIGPYQSINRVEK